MKYIAPGLPPTWCGGYVHYHTCFRHDKEHAISPESLRDEVEDLGCGFLFCAGDHGSDYGPGWYGDGDYYELVNSFNREGSSVAYVPTGEYHLWFPGKESKDRDSQFWRYKADHPDYMPFHHTLMPSMEWHDDFAAYVGEKTSSAILDMARTHGVALTLNHPGLCFLSGHPDPFVVPWLGSFSYYELYNEMRQFGYDLPAYRRFLAGARSSRMAVFAGVDFLSSNSQRLSTPGNEKAANVTYLNVPPDAGPKKVLKCWAERRTYAVHGRLYLEQIEPAPRVAPRKADGGAHLVLTVRHFGRKKINTIEILKNGSPVFFNTGAGKDFMEIDWRDADGVGKEATYIVIVEAEGDYLVTSPITYRAG